VYAAPPGSTDTSSSLASSSITLVAPALVKW
jgi:hypothetical protein